MLEVTLREVEDAVNEIISTEPVMYPRRFKIQSVQGMVNFCADAILSPQALTSVMRRAEDHVLSSLGSRFYRNVPGVMKQVRGKIGL